MAGKSPFNIKAILIGAGLAWFVWHNRFLFGLKCPPPEEDFQVLTQHQHLDKWLSVYKNELADDYDAYRNHCLRVLSYAKHLLPNKDDKQVDKVLGVAVAHHDIALWKGGVLSYLEPSAAVLAEANHGLTDQQLKVANEIIMQHHKFTSWSGPSFSDQEELMVNAVRKADWTDFTFGLVRYGFPLGNVCAAFRVVPEAGFHNILNGMGARLSPDSLIGRLDVLKIFRW